MITCIHQRDGRMYFDVPVKKSLLEMVCNNVKYGATLFTDEYIAYNSLEEHGFTHKSVNHSQKEYANVLSMSITVSAEVIFTSCG